DLLAQGVHGGVQRQFAGAAEGILLVLEDAIGQVFKLPTQVVPGLLEQGQLLLIALALAGQGGTEAGVVRQQLLGAAGVVTAGLPQPVQLLVEVVNQALGGGLAAAVDHLHDNKRDKQAAGKGGGGEKPGLGDEV